MISSLLLVLATSAWAVGPDDLLTLHASDDHRAAQSVLLSDTSSKELATLSKHTDWRVRQEAAAALTWLQDPEGAAAMWSIQPERTRSGIPRFLGDDYRDPALTPILIERLMYGDDPTESRMALVEVIPRSGGEWSAAITDAIGGEGDPQVRRAMVAIMRYADEGDALRGLNVGLQDSDAGVRADAARTVGWRSEGAELGPELMALLGDETSEVRGFAARSLGWLDVAEAWDGIEPLLADADAGTRLFALRALERLDAEHLQELSALQTLTGDRDARVARAASKMIGD